MNSIEVEGLVRRFSDVLAVAGIDMYVRPGEVYGFLGPNGAGKSTTIFMLTTLLAPSAGRARLGGFDLQSESARVRSVIGAALQQIAIDPLLNGREHILMYGALHGIARADRKHRAQELLARMGLDEVAERRVACYSGGMKRRLALALALIHRPRVLFLDEPSTGLDVQSRRALWDEIRRLVREDGLTVLLTTQYLEEADVLADRVGIIDHGRIVAEGTPFELKAQVGGPAVQVVPSDPSQLGSLAHTIAQFGTVTRDARSVTVHLRGGEIQTMELMRVLDRTHSQLAAIRTHTPSLDEVFIAKTGRSLDLTETEPMPARRGFAPWRALSRSLRGA